MPNGDTLFLSFADRRARIIIQANERAFGHESIVTTRG